VHSYEYLSFFLSVEDFYFCQTGHGSLEVEFPVTRGGP